LEGSLIGGYMIRFGVNRRYGIWMNIYTDLCIAHVNVTFTRPISQPRSLCYSGQNPS